MSRSLLQWHCWHWDTTLTNALVCMLSKFFSCKLICFLLVCFMGKSCTEKTFQLEVGWCCCRTPAPGSRISASVVIAPEGFRAEPAEGTRGLAGRFGNESFPSHVRSCALVHCSALGLSEQEFKLSQFCSFCRISAQSPCSSTVWISQVQAEKGLQTCG